MQDDKWKMTMDQEIKSIQKNNTWELTSLTKGQRAIRVKWVYNAKKNSKGEVEKYKARLVMKGYKQRVGIDYDEVFTPTTRLETIRLLASLRLKMVGRFTNGRQVGIFEKMFTLSNPWAISSKEKKTRC